MTLQAEPATPRRAWRPVRGWVAVRAVLLLAMAAVMGLALASGTAPGRLSDLTSLLRAGQLREVSVAGSLGPGSVGCMVQQVTWRHGVVARRVDVVVQRGDTGGCSGRLLIPRVDDAATWVHRLDPHVTVHREPLRHTTTTLGGWEVPGALAGATLALVLAQLFLLIGGPQPWRATRWAWFWLMGSVVGAVAFLVLSGPFPGTRPPRDPGRRLTGGWAFLLGMVLQALTARWFFGLV